MSTIESTAADLNNAPSWLGRVQILMGAALIWLVLVHGLEVYLLPRAQADAIVLLGSAGGTFAGLAAALVIFAVTFLIGRLIPLSDGTGPMLMLGLALTAWSMTGGTVDAWLLGAHATPGPGTATPFVGLLGDYVSFGLIFAALAVMTPVSPTSNRNPTQGPLALALMVIFGAALTYLLAGPSGRTYHGQVIFGVGVANWGAVQIARNLTGVTNINWYWPAPIIVGILAIMICAAAPSTSGPLGNLNVIPPWAGIARPLPIQYVGMGIATIVMTMRSRNFQEAAGS